ncbi:MAG: dihydrofolate reductase family protein [Solirubrobacteraceae bacterium]
MAGAAAVRTAETLLSANHVDEVRLMVFPFELGTGERLFGEASEQNSMRLLGARPVGESLAHLRYEVIGEA